MTVYIFTGPTLPPALACEEIDAVFLPPVSQGDIIRLFRAQPTAIGIIDGYFENVPSVWHKEILYALSRGVPVYGSASMGALRAAELAPFGMQGVGAIFEAFRDGVLEDDDEVAVLHGPPELGYPILSEAMVNIRRTLSDALAQGIIGEEMRRRMEAGAKACCYRERSFARMIRDTRRNDAAAGQIEAFAHWLPQGRVDQKREDATLMLRCMQTPSDRPSGATFKFEQTRLWNQAVKWAESDVLPQAFAASASRNVDGPPS
jgi:hypothetical protein